MRNSSRGKRDPNAKCACCRDCMDKVGQLGQKCKVSSCQEFMCDAHAPMVKQGGFMKTCWYCREKGAIAEPVTGS